VRADARGRNRTSWPPGITAAILPKNGAERGARKLDTLLAAGVSRIDLCGNGVVTVPGELLVYRSGRRNRFKEEPSIRAPYSRDTSLVARSLLLEPTFDAVGDIQAFVASRGGSLTIGTASKALKQLEEDLVIERAESPSVRLLQADRLLDQLAANYRPPKILRKWTGKTSLAAGGTGPATIDYRCRGVAGGPDWSRLR
jgi:hypothetical protein